MSSIIDSLIAKNPLLGHGPRTHATGVVLPEVATVRARRPRVSRDVDAPRVHLGHAGRAA